MVLVRLLQPALPAGRSGASHQNKQTMKLSLSRGLSILLVACAGQTLRAQFGLEHAIPIEGPVSVAPVDLDLDGDVDLVAGTRAGLGWLQNTDGQGTMGALVGIGAADIFVHAADLDADGDPDIVSSVDLNGGIRWYANAGAGTFGAPQTISAALSASDIRSSDLDGDGDPDLVFALENGDVAWSANTDGAGSFGALQTIATAQAAEDMQCADLDGDGLQDLLWSNRAMGPVHFALNQGGGSMGPIQTVTGSQLGRVADIDGDGLDDLISYSSASSALSWQRNLGGAFDAVLHDIGTGIASPTDLVAADLNGDGTIDVAVAEQFPDRLVWYANEDGAGGFGAEQEAGSALSAPRSPAIGDLDGDGDAELIATSVGQQRYVWYDNLSLASFTISGRVFNDRDNNGVFGGIDHGLNGMAVRLSDGSVAYTNAAGMYSFQVASGTYTIEVDTLSGWAFTASDPELTVNVPFTGEASLGNDFAFSATGSVPELTPVLTTSPRKCGYEILYWLDVTNTGNEVGEASLALSLDPLNTFVSSEPAFDSRSGQRFTWDLHDLAPTHARQVLVRVLVPSAENIGTTVVDSLRSELRQMGNVVHSTVWTEAHTLTCAYDPNDKQVMPEGATPQHFVATGLHLTYTIRFQNTGTAPAEHVVVIDTLDAHLDPATLEIMGASHTMHVSMTQDHVLRFDLPNIQLPDSGSNEPASHGHVTFRIGPDAGLPDLTVVENSADIVFDVNAPVRTNTVFNTFSEGYVGLGDAGTGSATLVPVIRPNPITDVSMVQLPEAAGPVRMTFSDVRGTVVREWTVPAGVPARVERTGLAPGMYYLRATCADARFMPFLIKAVVR